MYRLGRMVLWLFPPLGLWRSIAAGRRKRDARLVAALGGDPKVVSGHPSLARWMLNKTRH